MYKRKTEDEWRLHVNYGQGFEEVTAERTLRDIRIRQREYETHELGYPNKVTGPHRVPIAQAGWSWSPIDLNWGD